MPRGVPRHCTAATEPQVTSSTNALPKPAAAELHPGHPNWRSTFSWGLGVPIDAEQADLNARLDGSVIDHGAYRCALACDTPITGRRGA
jgi:hypothetical protein